MKRADFDEAIREIREVSPYYSERGATSLAIREIEERRRANEDVSALLEFIKASKRGVCSGA